MLFIINKVATFFQIVKINLLLLSQICNRNIPLLVLGGDVSTFSKRFWGFENFFLGIIAVALSLEPIYLMALLIVPFVRKLV